MKRTYDIVNAGPRNRFALANGAIVSNSGRLVQPHNFIRGNLKYEEQLRILQLLQHADHEIMSTLYEWPISAIGACMRGFILPSPGKILRVVDYASIEARVLAWLAEEHWVLQAYVDGLDVYKLMASGVFNVSYEDVTSEQRRIGKNLVLGCFAADTEVLTDRGWVRIVDVQLSDRLWDGFEWVVHEGVICQGLKNVIELNGVEVTPDHLIWNGSNWLTASDMAGDSKSQQSALSAVRLPSSLISSALVVDSTYSNAFAVADDSRILTSTTLPAAEHEAATTALNSEPQTGLPLVQITQDASTKTSLSEPSTDLTGLLKNSIQGVQHGLRRALNVVHTKLGRATFSTRSVVKHIATIAGDFRSTSQTQTPCGFTASGTTCSVAYVNSAMGKAHCDSKTLAGIICTPSSSKLERYPATRLDRTSFSSTVSTTSAGTAQLTVGSQLNKKISKTPVPTFDIKKCGPRSQFVIRTRSGSLIVHNCGYGLGGAKFVAYSEKAGVEITEAFAKAAVKSYRTKHPKIITFWYDVERAAVTAVREQRDLEHAVVLRNLKFYIDSQWLCIELPQGRCLRYYRPKVVPVEKFGQPSLQLQFKTEFRGRLVSESTYGGKIVENITQAVARDILANGMYEAERSGYPVMGTVHDEILTEQYPDEGSVHELEMVVCRLPKWARGLPIAAEGFESYRYRKG